MVKYLAIRATDDTTNMFRPVFGSRRWAVATLESGRLDRINGGADELKRLIERIRVAGARVQDYHSKLDATQKVGVGVDLVYGKQHRFQPLNTTIFVDGTASRAICAWDRPMQM